MILSARVGASGFYGAIAVWIATQAARPRRLLALTITLGGILSAFLVYEIVVFAMTPLLWTGLASRQLEARRRTEPSSAFAKIRPRERGSSLSDEPLRAQSQH
jgi:Na+/H+ antiporter NhaD/arsenite permease-like protein